MSESARKDTAEQAEFREYCRDWLKDNRPGDPPVRLPQTALEIMTTEQMDYLQAWQKAAYDAGLVGADATELVHELLLARKAELLPEDIAGMIQAHPTLSETVMEAARGAEGWTIHA